jgi:hypothetical protein
MLDSARPSGLASITRAPNEQTAWLLAAGKRARVAAIRVQVVIRITQNRVLIEISRR